MSDSERDDVNRERCHGCDRTFTERGAAGCTPWHDVWCTVCGFDLAATAQHWSDPR